MSLEGNAGARYLSLGDGKTQDLHTHMHTNACRSRSPFRFFGGELVWKSWSAILADKLDMWLARASYCDNLTHRPYEVLVSPKIETNKRRSYRPEMCG